MTNKQIAKQQRHSRRKARVRAKVVGTAKRPRLQVFRSLNHISAQLIDDVVGKTLAAASDKELGKKEGSKVDAAKNVGIAIAKKAKDAGISEVVFDRSGYAYHGRIKALAEGAREGGLNF